MKAIKRHGKGPKILFFDIETSPIKSYHWGLFDQNIGLNQIDTDWFVLSWAAKWAGPSARTVYMDQRFAKDIEDDKRMLQGIWDLLNEADIVITQNGIKFDQKKLFARFIINGFKPPSSFQHIDTLRIAKKNFAFTSNKLEYMTDKLNTKYKKLKHAAFPGFELWKECLRGNPKAWREMEKYNRHDVLALEELYGKLMAWDHGVNFDLYSDDVIAADICKCGGLLVKNGHCYNPTGKFQRFRCFDCGAEVRGRDNLFSKEKKKSLRVRSR